MSQAKRDENRIPTILGVSSTDSTTPIAVYADPTTHRLLVDVTSGGTTTVDAGTTTTGNAGTNASVVNSGTTTNAVFDFTIPRGNTGATGATGPTGPIGMTWQGAYDNAHAYVLNDGVYYLGSSYINIQAGTGNLPTDTSFWSIIALKGTDGTGSGTVTSVSVATANGFSGTVANATSTPDITIIAGAITPTSVNSLTLASQTTGFTIAGGTTPKTLTVPLDASVSGTNTGDQTNISGNAATVTTNANLTGVVTSVGNATAIADAALSIAKTSGLQTALDAKETTANKDATGGYAGLTLFKINFKNALNTITSFFTNANTVARTYTFQDRDGTVADNTDLALKANLASPTFTGTVTLPSGQALVAPALGTPASGVMTNVTGLPAASVVAGVLGVTGTRMTKLWATDIESTNAPTVGGVVVPTISSTNTLTNKRTNPRVVETTSYTTDTGTSLDVSTTDIFVITAQAGALLFNAPGGTPVQGQSLVIRIKDNGTARALTWNAVFRAMGTALPSTTVLSKTLYLGFFYNSTDTTWDLVASAQQA